MTPLLPALLAAALLQAAPSALNEAVPASAVVPDFSGNWALDFTRSETMRNGGNIDRAVVITQTGGAFVVLPSGSSKPEPVTFAMVDPAKQAGASGGIAYWDGVAMITQQEGTLNGKSVVIKQVRSLSPGGRELVVDTNVSIQHGYAPGEQLPQSNSRDIYVRASN